jgi:nucleoside 2-deoxyribosyltransferase
MHPHLIYLSGPIMGCTDEEAMKWRNEVKRMWTGETLDPMRRDYRYKEVNPKELVEFDKADIRKADAVLAYCPFPSHGTSMEILYAWEQNKPVAVVVWPDKPISPWVRYHSHFITTDFSAAIRYLQKSPL